MAIFVRKLLSESIFYNAPSGGLPAKCGCGSWKKHWLRYSSKTPNFQCLNAACDGLLNVEFDGSHIIFQSNSPDQYIVPLCKNCNRGRSKSYMRADRKCYAVLAEKGKRCGPDETLRNNQLGRKLIKKARPKKKPL